MRADGRASRSPGKDRWVQRLDEPAAEAIERSDQRHPIASSGNSSTISSNDFLTLLVTEMKNQDPTANTDPTSTSTSLFR